MKCLDKKRIKMKQGETLALNERIMLSLVSTGVSIIIPFYFCIMTATCKTCSSSLSLWDVRVNLPSPWALPTDSSSVAEVRMDLLACCSGTEPQRGSHCSANSLSHLILSAYQYSSFTYLYLKYSQHVILPCEQHFLFCCGCRMENTRCSFRDKTSFIVLPPFPVAPVLSNKFNIQCPFNCFIYMSCDAVEV